MAKKTKAQKLAELISLSMKVQQSTKYCVFISFSGHVDKLDISIRESEENYTDHIADAEWWHIYKKENESFEKRYRELKHVLVNILETGEFDPNHENVQVVERIEYDYKF